MASWSEIKNRAQAPISPKANMGMGQAQTQVGLGNAAYQQGLGAQRDVYRQLQDQAAGRGGPSLAMMQQQQANQQNVVDQMGVLSQARGGSLAAQQRQAQGLGAAAAMGTAQQAAQLRAAEQAQAMQALQGQANTMGGQGLQQMMGANAAMQGIYGQQYAGQLQADIANQQAAAEQLERNRALAMQGIQMGLGAISSVGTLGAGGMF